jgi:hypothetical protein
MSYKVKYFMESYEEAFLRGKNDHGHFKPMEKGIQSREKTQGET